MSTRKPCVNVPSASYSGKEQSPLHFGLSAEGYELNTIMEGFDHMLWIVKIKNNKKVWVRQSPVVGKMVHEEPVIDHTNAAKEESPKQTLASPVEPIPVITQKESENVKPVPEIMKPVVEEKKITDYNLFLTYRLHELKKNTTGKVNNKEVFNTVIAEWKELKKNTSELNKVMADIKAKQSS